MNAMAISSCTLLLILLAIRGSIQKSNPASSTYRAAVVEFSPSEYTNDPVKTMSENAVKIVSFIEQAREREADIVVFPELAFTSLEFGERADMVSRSTVIPDPSQNYSPCTNSSIPVIEALKPIACAAERNGIYVVVNLLEKELCSQKNCPKDGMFIYLTSVVFDREGKIIGRSRKSHSTDNSKLLNLMKTPELESFIFDTDFGVTFGSVICFEILFEDSLMKLRRQLNITDFVHASGWYSSMPFLTTTQMVAGLAYTEDVTLLSSGYNDIRHGYSGSGIYAGRQGLVTAVLPLTYHEELLVADVWKKNKETMVIPLAQNNDDHHLGHTNPDRNHHVDGILPSKPDSGDFNWRYDTYDGAQSILIAENGFTAERLSHMEVDCDFEVNITNLTPLGVTYRLLAFDGVHHISSVLELGNRICAIVLCANDTIESCGHVWDTPATFNSINFTAIYADNGRTIMMPNTLATNMMPFKDWTWDQYEHEGRIYTSISLTKPTQDLITFGFWGRNFDRDLRSFN